MDIYYKKYIKYKIKYINLRDQIGSSKKGKNSGKQSNTPPPSNPKNCLRSGERISTMKSHMGKDIKYKITTKSDEVQLNPKDYENKDSRDKVFFHTFLQNKKKEVRAFDKIKKIVLASKPKTSSIPEELLCFDIKDDGQGRKNDGPIDRNITDQIINKITEMNNITRESDRPNYFIIFLSESSKHVSG